MSSEISRRQILASSAALLAACAASPHPTTALAPLTATTHAADPVIDIHQHANYIGRPLERLLIHQRKMGVTQTILLPFGSTTDTPATRLGRDKGLYKSITGTIDVVTDIAKSHPGQYFFFANEVPDLPGAPQQVEKYLKLGALGIGEFKFTMPCDAAEMQALYELAAHYRVSVLQHIEFDIFTTAYQRLGAMLTKYPTVNFIGHAQGFWANIDAAQQGQKIGYPKGKVTPGGLSDRYLTDYPNFYADMSGYSALNALIRDEDHARAFMHRHQDRMLFGSDCADPVGHPPQCTGASMIAAIRRLAPTRTIERKLLYENAQNLFKI